ncbi:MAG: HD domain-containing protein [Saprospiraceae bacterium]
MSRAKLLNDPVYGFISLPYGLLFDIVEHPWFQRLRRIKQVSLTHYVYPGALHTRFHHALGAFHLMQEVVRSLRSKGVEVTDEECEAVCAAILLHDIGHGPFSHTLEHTLIHVTHEELSLLFMEQLDREFGGRLGMAIRIFRGDHPKHFLHQLVSSQLDMDRLDYLNRDSYFTGVAEGVIGYDRIIKMLNVSGGRLVVEEKGIFSVEDFLIARRFMYWQVYLHKTVLSAEQMLIKTMQRARDLIAAGTEVAAPPALAYFLHHQLSAEDFRRRSDLLLEYFARLDDIDIAGAVKGWARHPDELLAYLARGLADRRLFRLEFSNEPFPESRIREVRDRLRSRTDLPVGAAAHLLISGSETNSAYKINKEEIIVLRKDGSLVPLSQVGEHGIRAYDMTKYFLCYPKSRD